MKSLFQLAAALLAVSSALVTAAPLVSSPSAEPTQWIVTSQQTWLGHRGRGEMFRVDKRGTPVVLTEVTEAEIAKLTEYVHEEEFRCGGFFAFNTREEAEAFLEAEPVERSSLLAYTIDNQATVNAWLPQASEVNIRSTISWLESFQNRYYTSSHGQQASLDLMNEWMEIAGDRSDVSVELVPCSNCGGQFSVVLTIQGQTLPNEIVVLGGHLDSTSPQASNSPETGRSPGADDDASGIAVLTETLRIALADGWKPQRTVKFMGYAAEEAGLRGSKAIAQAHAAAPRKNVYAVLQMDMINYTEPGLHDIYIFQDHVDTSLTSFVTQLFDHYLAPLGLTRGSGECGYGCSDHASWDDYGFPAAMVFETSFPVRYSYYHKQTDLLSNMGNSALHSVGFAKLALAFLGETAKTAVVEPEEPEEPEIFKHGFEAEGRQP